MKWYVESIQIVCQVEVADGQFEERTVRVGGQLIEGVVSELKDVIGEELLRQEEEQ